MSKKIIFGLVGLALIFAAGFGIYCTSIRQPQVSTQNPEAKVFSEPLAKLVYVGTNETLSEALYKLDLQDGKLDEPHIVLSVLEWDEHGVAIKNVLKFIDKNGKIIKKFVSDPKTDVWVFVTEKGEQIGGVSKTIGEPIKTKEQEDYLYDVNGNFLYKEYRGIRERKWAPNLSYRVDYPLSTYFFPPYEINVRDRKGKLIRSIPFDMKEHDVVSNVSFSNNGKYFAAVFPVTNKLFLGNNKGELIAKIQIDPKEIKIWSENICPTSDGNKIFLGGFDSKGWAPGTYSEGRDQYLIALDKNGTKKILYKSKEIQNFSISENEKYLVLATEKEIVLFDLENNYAKEVIYKGDLYKRFEKTSKKITNIWITNDRNVFYAFYDSATTENIRKRQLYLIEDSKNKILSETINISTDSLLYKNMAILVATADDQKEEIHDYIYIYRI